MQIDKEDTQSHEVIDSDLVSFFDLLAQYDFEDQQKAKSELKTDPPPSAPGGQF